MLYNFRYSQIPLLGAFQSMKDDWSQGEEFSSLGRLIPDIRVGLRIGNLCFFHKIGYFKIFYILSRQITEDCFIVIQLKRKFLEWNVLGLLNWINIHNDIS